MKNGTSMNCGQFDVKVFVEKFIILKIINANKYLNYVKITTVKQVFITLLCFCHCLFFPHTALPSTEEAERYSKS